MKGYKNSTKTVYETESSANYAKGGKAMAKTPMRKAEGGYVKYVGKDTNKLDPDAPPVTVKSIKKSFKDNERLSKAAGSAKAWQDDINRTDYYTEGKVDPKDRVYGAYRVGVEGRRYSRVPGDKDMPFGKIKYAEKEMNRYGREAEKAGTKDFKADLKGLKLDRYKTYTGDGKPIKDREQSPTDAAREMWGSRGYAEGGKVKAKPYDPVKAKPYDPVKDEPTSRPLTADQVRNIRNQMKANPSKKPAKRPYDPVLDEPTSRPFKKGGYVKKQAGGLLAEREMAARDMVGKAKGGAVSAVHKHERNMHPGKPLTKMRNGGKVGC